MWEVYLMGKQPLFPIGKVPFAIEGNRMTMIHRPSSIRVNEYDWREHEEFNAKMAIIKITRGEKVAPTVLWRHTGTNEVYRMSWPRFREAIMFMRMKDGIATGRWSTDKIGGAYTLIALRVDDFEDMIMEAVLDD